MLSDNDIPSSPSSAASSPYVGSVPPEQEDELSSVPPSSPPEEDYASGGSEEDGEGEEEDEGLENETVASVASVGRESMDDDSYMDEDEDSPRKTPVFFAPPTRIRSIPSPTPVVAHSPSADIYRTEVSNRLSSLVSSRQSLLPPKSYNIEQILTIPHGTPIHALSVPKCSSHIFSGGSDGFIRRYDFFDSLNGLGGENDRNLTMKQGGVHTEATVPIIPGGLPFPPNKGIFQPPAPMCVLVGYWENEEWSYDETPFPANGRKKEEYEFQLRELEQGSPHTSVGSGSSPQFLSPTTQNSNLPSSPGNPHTNGSITGSNQYTGTGTDASTSNVGEEPGSTKEEKIAALAAKYEIPWGPKAFAYSVMDPSPVYSLAIQNEELWGLSGTQKGNINLFTIRHDEGQTRHVFRPSLPSPSLSHRPLPISVLTLHTAEQGFVSGGWDGQVLDWDLEKVADEYAPVREYRGHKGQISAVEFRPMAATSNGGMGWEIGDDPEEWANGETFAINDRKRKRDEDDEEVMARLPSLRRPPAQNREDALPKIKEEEEESNASYDPLFDDDDDVAGKKIEAKAFEDSVDPSIPAFLHLPGSNPPPPQHPFPPSSQTPSNMLALPLNGQRPITPQQSTPSQSQSKTLLGSPLNLHGTNYPPPPQPPARLPPADESTSRIPVVGGHNSLPPLSNDVLLSSSIDGSVLIHDRRVPSSSEGGVRRLHVSTPWCASATWGVDGNEIVIGRRNSLIEIFDVRMTGRRWEKAKNRNGLIHELKLPASSGIVSCVKVTPDGSHLLSASFDTVRLWNLRTVDEFTKKGKTPFKIISGHHTAFISQMHIDPTCRYFITAAGNRGWEGASTETIYVHEMKAIY
ncbi:WD40 repeat-like protein [Atractiella rhizophila]|nr:WD40 repeat-like protein [Atractiella rhizophila]